MNERQRQTFVLVAVMLLLTVALLYLFVYAPEPMKLYRPDLPSIKELLKKLIETFNIFNYL